MRQHFQASFSLLLLAVFPCLLLWPVVFGGEVFLPTDLLRDVAPWRTGSPASLVPWNPLMWDGVAEFYPWRFFAASTLKTGFLPLWNPHQFCGTPFVANSQSAVFYPLNLLFCLLPVSQAFGVSVLLHLFLTGGFAYLFLRSPALGLGRPASLFGALAWQLCHWQVAWLALPTFLCVSAWLPLALLLTDRIARVPTAARAMPLGVSLGLMLLAGHLQIALYCFGLVIAYALFRLAPRLRSDWRALTGCAVLVTALAFGICAPQILPVLELARASHRAGGPATWAAYVGYVRLALPPVNLVTLFLPGFFGSPTRGTYWGIDLNGGPGMYMENACYGGVLTLLLALTGGIASWRTSAATRFFAVTAGVSLLLALGTPLNAVPFFSLPGFSQTGSPGRILVVWSFCIPTLAAVGLQAVLHGERRALGKSAAAFLLLFVLTFGYTAFWIGRHYLPGTLAANLTIQSDLWRLPTGILLAAAVTLWLWTRGGLKAAQCGGALALLTALDLLAAGYGFNRTSSPANVYPITPAIAFLQQHKLEGRIMPINHRWSLNRQPPPAILPPNAAMVYGLYDTQGYDSLLTGRYFQFAASLDHGSPAPPENGNMVFTNGYRSKEAAAASTRFIVSLRPLAETSLKLKMEQSGVFVYENADAAPHVSSNMGAAFRVMPGPPTRLHAEDGPADTAQIIVADQWYPGWRAWYDGENADITEGPFVFRTVTPRTRRADKAYLEMRYEPEAFRVGAYALCLAVGGVASVIATALIQFSCRRLNRRRL